MVWSGLVQPIVSEYALKPFQAKYPKVTVQLQVGTNAEAYPKRRRTSAFRFTSPFTRAATTSEPIIVPSPGAAGEVSLTLSNHGKHWCQQIPLGALLPVRVENVLPACKNLGVTAVTNGAFRVHPTEWNIGEAAGALAAYALERKLAPRQVRRNARHLEDLGIRMNHLFFSSAIHTYQLARVYDRVKDSQSVVRGREVG